jgi:hypothetical protein
MNKRWFVLMNFLLILASEKTAAQKIDSTYIKSYPQKMWITGYVSTNSFLLGYENNNFTPNYPINAGVGIGIRNTMVNLSVGHSILPLKGSKYGKTKSLDFQLHNYGRYLLVDAYYQKYKGFYTENNKEIKLFPDLSVQQIGAEATYIFNGDQFSAKAAFEQSEKQMLSAGSFLMGGGAYWHRIITGPEIMTKNNDLAFENLQLGVNIGYAYSWRIDNNWLVTGMASVGSNFGNEIEALKNSKIKIYPTALARASSTYQKNDWSVSFSFLINNKLIYSQSGNSFSLTSLNMQLAYVKQLDHIFRKKK